jgi:hypothetical protein
LGTPDPAAARALELPGRVRGTTVTAANPDLLVRFDDFSVRLI